MNYLPLPFAVVVLCLGGCDTTDEEPSSSRSEAVVPEAVVPQAAVPEVQTEPRLDDVTAESVGALLREQPGKVLMVNMWSTWCEPCVEEFPELVAVSQEYREQGVGMLFISADPQANREAALEFLVAQNAPMPSYIKTGRDGPFIEAVHPEWSGTLPATMLFDADRNPRFLWEETVNREVLEGPIGELLRETDG